MAIGQRHHRRIHHPHQLQIVGRDDNGRAQLVQLGEQAQQTHAHFRVDIARRFVGNQDFRLSDNRPCDGDALLFAPRKGGGQGRHLVAEPDPGQQFGDILGIV